MCEHCGALAFEAEKGWTVHNWCSFSLFFSLIPWNKGKERKVREGWQHQQRGFGSSAILAAQSAKSFLHCWNPHVTWRADKMYYKARTIYKKVNADSVVYKARTHLEK
jgi:hypothetical protein